MSTILIALTVLAAATPGLLITPAELTASLKDPAVVVIAVGTSDDDFIAGHIPGARFVRYSEIAIDADGPIAWSAPTGSRSVCRHRPFDKLRVAPSRVEGRR